MSSGTSGYAVALDGAQYTAVSAEANQVLAARREIDRAQQGAQTLSGRLAETATRLYAAIDALVIDDEQAAVPFDVVQNALRMMRALPDVLPLPEIGIDPDGAISLDWMPTRLRMFSISVSDSEHLAYAWLNGTDRGHGVARLVGGPLPGSLWLQLAEIVGDVAASLRAA